MCCRIKKREKSCAFRKCFLHLSGCIKDIILVGFFPYVTNILQNLGYLVSSFLLTLGKKKSHEQIKLQISNKIYINISL